MRVPEFIVTNATALRDIVFFVCVIVKETDTSKIDACTGRITRKQW